MRDEMTLIIRRFAGSDGGATAIEYGLIAALMAIAAIGGMTALGGGLGGLFGEVSSKSANAMGG